MDMWAFAASALIFSRSADVMRVLNLISFFIINDLSEMISLVPSECWGGFKWVWASARSLGVWGPAPPSAFGRAAASPQTRQMRCWLSAARAAYHSFPSLPPTKTRSLRCTAFFPPKPLCWVSAGALLGEVIKAPVLHFFGVPAWGWYHYPRRALHAVETLDAQELRRRIRRFYAVPEFALCGLKIPSAGTHATPAPNRAHSGSHAETRGVFTA